jgi:hypothetical protein
MHAALQILTYIICAPNGLCVILRRILSFCDQAKLFCCWMLFARLFLPLRELRCFWQGREENCSAGSQKACARHHLEALFDGSLIAHQIFGEKLMNGPLGMTQLYACSSSECFYSESSTFMDLRPKRKKWNAINILRLRNICSCINTDRL